MIGEVREAIVPERGADDIGAVRRRRAVLLKALLRSAYVNVTHATTRKMKIPFSQSAIFEVAANTARRRETFYFRRAGEKKRVSSPPPARG
jgi:hypothetical protein